MDERIARPRHAGATDGRRLRSSTDVPASRHALPWPFQLPRLRAATPSDAASWVDVVVVCPCLAWLATNQSDAIDGWRHCDTSPAVDASKQPLPLAPASYNDSSPLREARGHP